MGVKDSQELKGLQVRLEKATADRNALHAEAAILLEKEKQLDSLKRILSSEIKTLQDKNKTPIISEHALLRYIERVKGIDLEVLKKEIMTPQLATLIREMGNGKHPSGGGFKAIVKNNTVITIEETK